MSLLKSWALAPELWLPTGYRNWGWDFGVVTTFAKAEWTIITMTTNSETRKSSGISGKAQTLCGACFLGSICHLAKSRAPAKPVRSIWFSRPVRLWYSVQPVFLPIVRLWSLLIRTIVHVYIFCSKRLFWPGGSHWPIDGPDAANSRQQEEPESERSNGAVTGRSAEKNDGLILLETRWLCVNGHPEGACLIYNSNGSSNWSRAAWACTLLMGERPFFLPPLPATNMGTGS